MTKEQYFTLLLLVCSIFGLVTSASIMAFRTMPNDATDLRIFKDSTQNITSTSGNITQLETLIGWQGQGTINWGLGSLALISVFFAILFTLRRIEKGSSKDKNTKAIDLFLSSLSVLFLAVSVYAVFEALRYYRVVATLQSRWQEITKIIVPKGSQFDPLMNYCGEWGMIVLFSLTTLYLSISLLRNWKTPQSKKALTDEQLLKHFETLKQDAQKLEAKIDDFGEKLNNFEKEKKES